MPALVPNTTPDAEEVLVLLLREALPWHKLEKVVHWDQAARF